MTTSKLLLIYNNVFQKVLLFSLVLVSSSHAEGIEPEALDGIYTEAFWFIAVFFVMSIVSFFVSRRNAKKYEVKLHVEKKLQREQEQKEKLIKEKEDLKRQKELNNKDFSKEVDRLLELSKLLEKGHISEAEFQAFKAKLLT